MSERLPNQRRSETALKKIHIAAIVVERRLRQLSEAQVESLVASIADVGLLNPITVYERRSVASGQTIDGYGLVAGAHRLEACKRLGLVEIAANIVGLSDLERQIAECDENLRCAELSKSERALFTKRRKDAYEAMHPETKHGAIGNGREKTCQLGDSTSTDRFTADTAAKTGQSERAIQRDAERGEALGDDLVAIARTSLDKGVELDALAKMEPEERAPIIRRAQLGEHISARISDEALSAARSEREARKIRKEWNRAGPDGQALFLKRIGATLIKEARRQ